MAAIPRPPVTRLLAVQLVVALLSALIASLWSLAAAIDALLGGVIALIPQAVFSWMTFRHRGARKINSSVHLLLVGATVKFGLTVVLFAAVFIAVQPSNPISLLCAYIAVLSVHWLAPWLMYRKA